MPAEVITADLIVHRYADDIASVTKESPATDLGDFINQLDTAASRFAEAGINGHKDMEVAAIHLTEALNSSDETARGVFLARADEILYPFLWDMTAEYRDTVDD